MSGSRTPFAGWQFGHFNQLLLPGRKAAKYRKQVHCPNHLPGRYQHLMASCRFSVHCQLYYIRFHLRKFIIHPAIPLTGVLWTAANPVLLMSQDEDATGLP